MDRERICPECHADLNLKNESAKAHALSHWAETLPDIPENTGARARQAILYKMDAEDIRIRAMKEA